MQTPVSCCNEQSAIATISNLQYLEFTSHPVDLSFVGQLTNLEELVLENCIFSNWSAISNLQNLRSLKLDCKWDWYSVESEPQFQFVEPIGFQYFTKISSPKLNEFNGGDEIYYVLSPDHMINDEAIKSIGQLPHLEYLEVWNNIVEDWAPVESVAEVNGRDSSLLDYYDGAEYFED